MRPLQYCSPCSSAVGLWRTIANWYQFVAHVCSGVRMSTPCDAERLGTHVHTSAAMCLGMMAAYTMKGTASQQFCCEAAALYIYVVCPGRGRVLILLQCSAFRSTSAVAFRPCGYICSARAWVHGLHIPTIYQRNAWILSASCREIPRNYCETATIGTVHVRSGGQARRGGKARYTACVSSHNSRVNH